MAQSTRDYDAGEALKVIDKWSGQELGTVPIATRGDVAQATDSAARAFPAWSETPAHKRATVLHRAADLIEERRDSLAETITREVGKAWKHSVGEVNRTIETFTFAAEEAKRIHGENRNQAAVAAYRARPSAPGAGMRKPSSTSNHRTLPF